MEARGPVQCRVAIRGGLGQRFAPCVQYTDAVMTTYPVSFSSCRDWTCINAEIETCLVPHSTPTTYDSKTHRTPTRGHRRYRGYTAHNMRKRYVP